MDKVLDHERKKNLPSPTWCKQKIFKAATVIIIHLKYQKNILSLCNYLLVNENSNYIFQVIASLTLQL